MKNVLLTAAATIAFCTPAWALDIKAISEKPTADNPQFDNKEAWPEFVGDEYFLKQEWPEGRLLIWYPTVKTSTGGNRSREIHDPMNPANWINAATGRPAKSIPDMDDDPIPLSGLTKPLPSGTGV